MRKLPRLLAAGVVACFISGNSAPAANSGSPYTATVAVTVPTGQALTIDPGVVIRMTPKISGNLTVTLRVFGSPFAAANGAKTWVYWAVKKA